MSLNVLTYLSEGRSGELIFKRMLSCSFNWNTSTVCVHSNSLNRQRSDWMGPFFRPFILHLGLQWSSLTLKNSAVANLVEGSILSVTLQWADLLVLL